MSNENNNQRQVWTNKDIDRLLQLWSMFGSIMLIAAIMGRKPSSIQTQASRRQLPRRDSIPGQRRRWSETEDSALDEIALKIRSGVNIDILKLSNSMCRSIDAIINRLNQRYSIQIEDVLNCISIPTEEELRKTGRTVDKEPVKMRMCPMCLKKFVPSSPFNRVCSPCKNSETWRLGP